MTNPFGFTRSVLKERYALLAPAGFVASALPGWIDATCFVVISPEMGAGFTQTHVTFGKEGRGAGSTGQTELFVYVVEGCCTMAVPGRKAMLVSGSYAFIPPLRHFEFAKADEGTRLLLFQKTYQPLAIGEEPELLVEQASERPGMPFLGDTEARLQTLLPDKPEFDMAVNIFTYQPGATLPMVETHIMEHGMLFLGGQGIYRIDSDWHPVQMGDVIWMAPYCPQWFVAMGKTPASYIYYKNVNRAPVH
jgi:(S)-ureidoglycine aminohydrolase